MTPQKRKSCCVDCEALLLLREQPESSPRLSSLGRLHSHSDTNLIPNFLQVAGCCGVPTVGSRPISVSHVLRTVCCSLMASAHFTVTFISTPLLQVRGDELIGAILHEPDSFAVWWCESKGRTRPKRSGPFQSGAYTCWYCAGTELILSWQIPVLTLSLACTRKLKRSPRFWSTEQDAERIVHLLRQKGSWQGQAKPRRITVLINPVSGQGK